MYSDFKQNMGVIGMGKGKAMMISLVCLAVLAIFAGLAEAQVVQQDFDALVALYKSTNGDNWKNKTGWSITTNNVSSNWYGITVEGDRVLYIILDGNNLVGTIPPEIGNLTKLDFLSLGNNQLTGSIPVQIEKLTNLRVLNIPQNRLTGQIPYQLGNLIKLTDLNFSGNQLTGSIPPEIGNLINLNNLSLWSNNLSGFIPSEIKNLTNLPSLTLSYNQLTGTIPDLSTMTNLVGLALNDNQLTGNIPHLPINLKSIYLERNKLSGTIPDLSALNKLEILQLGNIYENTPDQQLTGPVIPSNLPNSLKSLLLRNFYKAGDFPNLSTLSNLESLSIYQSQFSGPINASNFPNSLKSLGIAGGYNVGSILNGGVIPDLSTLTNLKSIGFTSSGLTGPIIASNFPTSLEILYIGYNQLNGAIPDFSAFTNMTVLQLTYNKLCGDIPTSLINMSSLNCLSLSNNNLTVPSDPMLMEKINIKASCDSSWMTQTYSPCPEFLKVNIFPPEVITAGAKWTIAGSGK